MIYVMSDIHGMYEKYEKMLKQIDFSEKIRCMSLGISSTAAAVR